MNPYKKDFKLIEESLKNLTPWDLHESPYQDFSTPNIEQQIKESLEKISTSLDAKNRILNEFLCYGPLTALLDDINITEILINGVETIIYEKKGVFHKLKDHFLSKMTFHNFIHRVCEEAQFQIDLQTPFASGKWKDFRIHITDASMSTNESLICLRRHRQHIWSLSEFINKTQIPQIEQILLQRNNCLIIGPTGSGKTSFINACLNLLPNHERVILIEDTDEIKIPNYSSVKLLTRSCSQGVLTNYDQSDLIKEALRMRPQRLIIGEIRGGEAKDLILSLSTGHKGSISSLHAHNAKEALWRLELLIQMGAPQWNLQTIRQLIYHSIDTIITMELKDGKRSIQKIHKVHSLESHGITLQNIY